jgi:hypothetical protein
LPVMLNAASKAARLGYREGDMTGDKTQFGGTFAFDAAGRCVYAHRQDAWSFEPDLLGLLRSLGASDADVALARTLIYQQKKHTEDDKKPKQTSGPFEAAATAESGVAG